MFRDRTDAGKRLLARLPALDPVETLVVALPRGGVPVAEVIADGLGAPLDIVFVRKVGHPRQKELALAAVTDGRQPELTVNKDVARAAGLDVDEIWDLAKPELNEIARRREIYLEGREALPMTGKTVVVVDDGIATGATMRASLKLIRQRNPARLLLAVPVAPEETLSELASEVDDVICLEVPRPFHAVGAYYQAFPQVSDAEVTEAIARNKVRLSERSDK